MSNPDPLSPTNAPFVLSDDAAREMLERLEFFYGMSFNGMSGPFKCSRQVARVRPNTFKSVRVTQDISTEEFYPANEVDAQHIHFGWPIPSALPARPWDLLDQDTKAPSNLGNWVSRRMVVHRWTVSLRHQDLEPTPQLVKEMEEALSQPTIVDRIHACRGVFAAWGEMIPLGGYPERFSKSGFNEWLASTLDTDNSSTWEVVKVNHAIPITEILPKDIRQKLNRLFSRANIIFHSPSVGHSLPFNFDGTPPGVKDIQRIDVWYDQLTVRDISVVYIDGTASGPHSVGKGKEPDDRFLLARGEFITDVFVWSDKLDIKSIQFAKNSSQLSPLYGVQNGVGEAYVLSGGGHALLGLAGYAHPQSLWEIQAFWRGDVSEGRYRSVAATGTTYAPNGNVFNDYQFLGDPFTVRISQIRFRNTPNQAIAGFQVTYTSERGENTISQETSIRGTDAGAQDTWTLEEGEYITQVKGKQNNVAVYQLEFVTSKGNSKKIGQDYGEAFTLHPPNKGMVLHYMLGKSSVGYMQNMTFVWAMPPA